MTGTGVSSNDEIRKTCSGRKKGNIDYAYSRTYFCVNNFYLDGNPVLGLGYAIDETPSTHRVPPGGYSKGLW